MAITKAEGPLLGIDFGLRRVGLAITDSGRRMAVGAGSFSGLSGRKLFRAIEQAAIERGVKQIVIGEPPQTGRDAHLVKEGVDRLSEYLGKNGFSIFRWDEGYTTSAVLTDIKITGAKVKSNSSGIDEGAAVLILQSYLDYNRNRIEDN